MPVPKPGLDLAGLGLSGTGAASRWHGVVSVPCTSWLHPTTTTAFPISANDDQTSLFARAVSRYRQTGAFFAIKRGLKL